MICKGRQEKAKGAAKGISGICRQVKAVPLCGDDCQKCFWEGGTGLCRENRKKEKAVSGKRNENCMQPVKQWAAGGTGISGVGSKMRRDEVQKAWISVKRSA